MCGATGCSALVDFQAARRRARAAGRDAFATGDGCAARRSNNGVDASNPSAATGSFSGSAAGAKCVCCVENMGDVDADDRGLRPHWLRGEGSGAK